MKPLLFYPKLLIESVW